MAKKKPTQPPLKFTHKLQVKPKVSSQEFQSSMDLIA